MNTVLARSLQKSLPFCGWMAACLLVAGNLGAQSVSPRIRSEISLSQTTPLKGSLHPLAQPAHDAGRVPADTKLNSVSILFNRSAAQQADLDALIAAQQNPSSPQYHKWLTPEQFGKRFGMAQADLDKITTWLEQQGFSIDMVARSRTFVRFSGTVRQVEAAFSTQMHYYKVDGVQHFAPSTELSVPAAAAATIQTVHNLDDFRPKSQAVRPHRNFTSSQTGNVYFAPGDIVTAYDVTPLVTSNITGSGQSIAVIGQSAVLASDIENFQNAAGLTVKDPTMVLMPGTGSSATFSGDETESDLDLEWSGALAPGANIYFVYTGSDTNVGAFDSLQYAIDSKIGDIITVSYGSCEPLLNGFSLETSFQEAATQGQSVIAASGDSGSTACFSTSNPGTGDPTLAQQEQVAVNYPASSPYVTGIGGTEITSANDAVGAYWGPATNSSTDNINSLLQYIPEVAWNDDSPNCGTDDCLSASGGGASALFPKPSWQTGVTGIPTANNRYVPDISLYASPNLPGYLLCTSDSSAWATNQQASCNSGFRDSATGALTVEGGTSFATPIFAGMLALLNQKNGYTSGQGLINPSLYTLASSSGTYASAFHDVTTGNNDCTGGSADCSSSTNGFNAGTGYDEVTGLGSIDLNALAGAWPSSTSTLIGTTTTVTAANSAPQVNVSDTFTITVSSDTGSTVPSGNVTLIVDGGTPITGNALSSNGTVTYAATFTSAGMHQIVAQYLGDSTHAPSTGVGSVTIAGTSSGKGTIALSSTPSTLTVTQGSSGVETITVTPAGGYTGTVYLTFVTSNDTALTNLCYDFPNITTSGQGPVTIGSTAAVSTQLTLDTLPSDCGAAQPHKGGAQTRHRLGSAMVARNGGGTPKQNSPNKVPAYAALAGLLLVGFMGRYARKFTALAGMVALLAVGLAVTACGSGGGGGTTVTPDPPKGTYTVTVTGTDSVTSTITGTTTFTFVIQ